MQDKEQVFLYMKEEIEKIAAQEEAAILKEVKELEQAAYEQIKAEAKADAAKELNKELAEISSKANEDASVNLEERTKKLVAKRDDYVKAIFDEAKERLMTYVTSQDYHDYLLNHVRDIALEYQMEDCQMFVKETDLSFVDELKKAYGLPIDIEASQRIQIGGFIIENPTTHVVVDESLDFALESQKDWFYKTSGLMIK